MIKRIPSSVSDTLLHEKETDDTERVILPITRYKNVLNSPNVVKSPSAIKGAPFLLYQEGFEELSVEDIRRLTSGLI